jgi:ribokinase
MIIVFGAISMDVTVTVPRFPQPGETVLSPSYDSNPGGKGANQALAAARAGAKKVVMIGKVGDDGSGLRILNSIRREGVVTSGVGQSATQRTGHAIIAVDHAGENEVIVAPGANSEATADQIPDEILKPGVFVLMQMEANPAENMNLLRRAKAKGATTMLNLAPALNLEAEAFGLLDYLIVNEIEAKLIAKQVGIDFHQQASKIAQMLAERGTFTCIVTTGPAGSIAITPERQEIAVPALKLDRAVDTTGAGDCYCGTLAASLQNGMTLPSAMLKASAAASLSCLTRGAQVSFPYMGDVEARLPELGEPVIRKI